MKKNLFSVMIATTLTAVIFILLFYSYLACLIGRQIDSPENGA